MNALSLQQTQANFGAQSIFQRKEKGKQNTEKLDEQLYCSFLFFQHFHSEMQVQTSEMLTKHFFIHPREHKQT